jgi:hypothetical protein
VKILVCGSRDWGDGAAIRRELEAFPQGTIIVHGSARGADFLAGFVANKLGFEVRAYPAMWDQEGKAAGPKRNARMLREEHPDVSGVGFDLCLAFTRDLRASRGTGDMVRKARSAGIRVRVIGDPTWVDPTSAVV